MKQFEIILKKKSILKWIKDKKQIYKKATEPCIKLVLVHIFLFESSSEVRHCGKLNYLLESTAFGLGLSVPFCILIFICHHDKRLRSNPLRLLLQRYQTFICWHKSASPSDSVLWGLEIFRATEINKRATLNTDNYSEPPTNACRKCSRLRDFSGLVWSGGGKKTQEKKSQISRSDIRWIIISVWKLSLFQYTVCGKFQGKRGKRYIFWMYSCFIYLFV